MPRVYRIENEDGCGPYIGHSLNIPQFSSARHPTPSSDPGLEWDMLSRRDDWRFGFISLEQLHEWFCERQWLQEMHDAGLRIAVYDVDQGDLRASATQAVFIRDAADFVATQPLIH